MTVYRYIMDRDTGATFAVRDARPVPMTVAFVCGVITTLALLGGASWVLAEREMRRRE